VGVSITYCASFSGNEVQEAALSGKVDQVCGDKEWYIESPNFNVGFNSVSGSSKLFRLYDSDGKELDPSEESPKVLHDIERLINFLEVTAKQYSIHWELSIEDAPIGSIGAEGADPELNKTLSEMVIVFGSGMTDESIEQMMLMDEPDSQKKKPWWKIW
jgi:hypothetical protein